MIKLRILFIIFVGIISSATFANPNNHNAHIAKNATHNKYIFEAYSITRSDVSGPNINYYLSRPDTNKYPIVVLVGGSTDKDHLASIAEFHRYFWNDISQTNI